MQTARDHPLVCGFRYAACPPTAPVSLSSCVCKMRVLLVTTWKCVRVTRDPQGESSPCTWPKARASEREGKQGAAGQLDGATEWGERQSESPGGVDKASLMEPVSVEEESWQASR